MPAPVVAISADEILTGEAVALDVQPVGLIMRTLGAAIDVALAMALLIALQLLGGAMAANGYLSENSYRIFSIASLVVCLVLLPAAVETLGRGRSLGKLAVGARIVRADGGHISARHAAIRALLGVLEIYMTLGCLAFLVGAFTPRSQRLGDLVAGTYSERTRSIRLTETAIPLPPALTAWAGIADVGHLPVRLSRRLSQFVHGADAMVPHARARIAAALAAECSAFVTPLPQVDPETFVRGVVVVRREREYRALVLEDERAAKLLGASQPSRSVS